jgi:hypothetical protein
MVLNTLCFGSRCHVQIVALYTIIDHFSHCIWRPSPGRQHNLFQDCMGSHSTMRFVLYVGLDLQIVTCIVVLQKGFIAMVLVMDYLEQSCIRARLQSCKITSCHLDPFGSIWTPCEACDGPLQKLKLKWHSSLNFLQRWTDLSAVRLVLNSRYAVTVCHDPAIMANGY